MNGLLGSGTQKAEHKTKIDPLARPIQVGWTSARAAKCGFYFNPRQFRSAYLAYESGKGLSGAEIQKYEQAYDFTVKSVSKKIKNNPDYCNKKRVEEIRVDLQRHLKGDYTPRKRKSQG